MTGPTKGTFAAIHQNADRHRTTADGFRKDNDNVRSEVDGLVGVSKGDLFIKLDQLQDDWSMRVNGVVQKLSEMAEYLDQVGNELEQQDAGSGSGLK